MVLCECDACEQALERVAAEYREMPDLSLTREQVQRLCGLESVPCHDALAILMQRRILRQTTKGTFVRFDIGDDR